MSRKLIEQASALLRHPRLADTPMAGPLAALLDTALPYTSIGNPERYPVYVAAVDVARAVVADDFDASAEQALAIGGGR